MWTDSLAPSIARWSGDMSMLLLLEDDSDASSSCLDLAAHCGLCIVTDFWLAAAIYALCSGAKLSQ
jgi:hypothetical protein